MGLKTFNNYALLAKSNLDYTQKSGRYSIQSDAEKLIIPEIISKLDLESFDTLLEIGCGLGNLLIPLSYYVKSVSGVDHPEVTEKLKSRAPFLPISLIDGNFLDINAKDQFNKILIYSVLHCLSDFEDVIKFIKKALSLLQPGGRLLLGDIPNVDRKKRFTESAEGKKFQQEWEQKLNQSQASNGVDKLSLDNDHDMVLFNDALIIEIITIIRDLGYAAWSLPQDPNLPFGKTREDILVVREYY